MTPVQRQIPANYVNIVSSRLLFLWKMSRYLVFSPTPALSPFIEKYTINEIPGIHTSRVIPDLSVVMGFQFGGNLSLIDATGTPRLDPLCLTGMGNRYRLFHNSAGFGIVLVYFKPAGASLFFEPPLQEFFQSSISLKAFDKGEDLHETEDRIASAKDHKQRIDIIDQFLLKRLQPARYDPLVSYATRIIRSQDGDLRIKILSQELGISQSRLEKRFRRVVGCSPKKYSTIVRLRSVAASLTSNSTLTQVSLDSGHYDQAHFNKAFKSFTGMTPKDYLRP